MVIEKRINDNFGCRLGDDHVVSVVIGGISEDVCDIALVVIGGYVGP